VAITVLSVSGGRIYGLTPKARALLGLRVARTEIVLRADADGRQERLAREVLATELEREPIALLDLGAEVQALWRYRLPDGRSVAEDVQAHAEGALHLALRGPDGEWLAGSLWPAEEIERGRRAARGLRRVRSSEPPPSRRPPSPPQVR
jgi:hypothetical protein